MKKNLGIDIHFLETHSYIDNYSFQKYLYKWHFGHRNYLPHIHWCLLEKNVVKILVDFGF